MTLANLRALAKAHGIETTYRDMKGKPVAASADALISILQAKGVAIRTPAQAARIHKEHRAELRSHALPPVLVAWDGKLVLPAGFTATLEGEDRRERPWKPGKRIPPGYWELEATKGRTRAHSFVISAPRRAFAPPTAAALGFFAPIYALRSSRNLGVGDFSDLAELLAWSTAHRASHVGTLPFLAAFVGQHDSEPFDPSPYAPASRMFWNELLLDLERAPEMFDSPHARALLETADVQRELRVLRALPRVDYRRVAAIKLPVLALLAQAFFHQKGDERHRHYEEFRLTCPELDEYAEFRAQGNARLANQHRYAQFLCHEQLAALTSEAKAGLYLDLPIGAHRDSWDLVRHRDEYALAASIGAPPDAFFTSGQNWGFPPQHPERMRHNRYRYLRSCLAHQMRYASMLRIDHVMGLHRLLWIPAGGEPKDGLYVRYPQEELLAVVCLESHRNHCAIAGEDLGLVPDEVRAAMKAHGLLRLFVLPWELGGEQQSRPNPIPRDCVASLNTHDMLPFASQWGDPNQDYQARKLRKALHCEKGSLTDFFAAASTFLLRSKARRVLVNLEDLWLETEPQNVPGTVGEENWSRKCHFETTKITVATAPALAAISGRRRTRPARRPRRG